MTMTMERHALRTRAHDDKTRRASMSIEHASWNQLGFLNYTRPHFAYYGELLDRFPDYQLCLWDEEADYPVAVANCVPLTMRSWDELPPEGWDWIVETAAKPNGRRNVLGALAISVPAVHRGKGYARQMIAAMQDLARDEGLDGMIAPVRPSAKSRHPFAAINDYITWTDDRGRPYDPWLRSHISAGGSIVRPCERSMVVEEPVAFWETWTKQRFEKSGDYPVEGGLVPVSIELERQIGRYAEPNVWFAYKH